MLRIAAQQYGSDRSNNPARYHAGVGDLLLDDNSMQAVPRPGTSLMSPLTHAGMSNAIRPVSASGRPLTGVARPGTSSRPVISGADLTGRAGTAAQRTGTAAQRSGTAQRTGTAQSRVATAMRSAKPGTARPLTTSGRFLRLGTASMATQPGGPFLVTERLDLRKYGARPHLARVLCDYILYSDHNAKAASVLCSAATVRTKTDSLLCRATV